MTEAEPGRRVLVGALALVGGLLAFVATFLPWISTDTEDTGSRVDAQVEAIRLGPC